jgi:hypothetical protein
MRVVRIITAVVLAASMPMQALPAQSQPPAVRVTPAASAPIRATAVATIRGIALTATNNPLVEARIRLRNARSGRIVNQDVTDRAGLFEFPEVDPGSYVVELVGSRSDVLAASDIMNPNGGDTISTVVKLPYEIPPAGGVLGHMHASALVVTATAAAAGLLATVVVGQDVSPRR